MRFTYEALPMRVVFGAGSAAALGDEMARLGLHRVLVLCTPGQVATANRVVDPLGDRVAGVFPGARMHVPAEVADAASGRAAELGADGCIAVGGGSTIGLGKAVALRHGLPVIAVPTTFAGSEMTPIWGLTDGGIKRTGRDATVLPRSVVYDPDLVSSLPPRLAVTSGFNAMAHAVEGLYAPDASPVVSLMAQEGVRLLVDALPGIAAGADSWDAALRGAWLCGAVLGATTMSLHHKLCHVLGGTFDLPHADVHTVVLTHVAAYNLPWAPAADAALQRVLGPDPAGALWDLAAHLGAPTSLAALGMADGGLPEVVRQVLAVPYANPRPVVAGEVAALLAAAQAGKRPGTYASSNTAARP
ncbi:maleylacetate reductase [Pseudonocardia sp.]|uniref:maleylacetate reductase n=1 Tax=Pseudonocardia sp. TaxID=60912 RepID=UPI003D101A20